MKTSKKVDWVWFLLLASAGLIYCIATQADIVFSSILLSGVACVGLIAIGKKEGYLVGLYNSIAYSWVAYQNGLFGEVLLNLLFFVPTGVLGYLMWRRHMSQHVVLMRQLSWKARGWVAALCVLGIAGLGWGLSLIPTQNTPYIDSTTNVLSVIATFLMMWRFKEQWLLYITLNIVSVVMWLFRWQAEGVAGDLMIIMWGLFLANSIFGYWRWSKGAKMTAKEAAA